MLRNSQRLDTIGERSIIEQVFKKRYYQSNRLPVFGDDCSFVSSTTKLANGTIVATTDPCPNPISRWLGYDDYYYDGWLLATINLSDLAAAGAKPLGLLTSLILPNDMTIGDLKRLLDGVDECCSLCGTQVIGGNLKEGPSVNLQATAIGICESASCVSRVGCREGDLIVVIGDLGLFWAGVLAEKKKISVDEREKRILLKNILTPIPKIKVGVELAKVGILTSCLDNSDGLYPSLLQLSTANHLQMFVNFENITFHKEIIQISSMCNVSPIRLSLGWGDWQLVGCVRPSDLETLREISSRHSVDVYVIGKVRNGEGVMLENDGKVGEMSHLDSQRFSKDSWFTAGLDTYIDSMINSPLWDGDINS